MQLAPPTSRQGWYDLLKNLVLIEIALIVIGLAVAFASDPEGRYEAMAIEVFGAAPFEDIWWLVLLLAGLAVARFVLVFKRKLGLARKVAIGELVVGAAAWIAVGTQIIPPLLGLIEGFGFFVMGATLAVLFFSPLGTLEEASPEALGGEAAAAE